MPVAIITNGDHIHYSEIAVNDCLLAALFLSALNTDFANRVTAWKYYSRLLTNVTTHLRSARTDFFSHFTTAAAR